MKKILIIDDNNSLKKQLEEKFSLNNRFVDLEVVVVKTYKEASSYISKYSDHIKLAIVSKILPDATNGKAVMLASSNSILSVILFNSCTEKDKLNAKFLKLHRVLKYYCKDDKNYKTKLIDYAYNMVRNSAYTALVVDDSLLYREKFKNDLQSLNLNVVVANDGVEAIKIFNSKKYNISLLITDYNMPNMDGIKLVRKIRKYFDNTKLAIIAISVDNNGEVLTKFIKVGANDYIHKPYCKEELSVRINSNLNILEMFEKISNFANRDFLTGAYNRRYFFEVANAIVHKNYRKQLPIALATVDIDKFKRINDTYGHDVGDIAIKETINILNSSMRESDLVARFGGEEFCILLEDISLENTKKLFEKIRQSFEDNKLVINDDLVISYTVSIGVGYDVNDDISQMIKKSDDALYEAKNTGRNKVIIIK